jgi:multisubunit Na+/H+ antiporter MnhB subunit
MKRFLVILAAVVFVPILATAMVDLAPAPLDLRPQVAANLAVSGVSHQVTAVLLNYRGYDTLLEIGVLLLALFGVLAATPAHRDIAPARAELIQSTLTRLAVPLMILVAGYLLWAGAFRPGGAFQAGAVLGAAAVLAHLVGLVPGWQHPGLWLRLGLVMGFVVFLAVAAATLGQGALLEYPPPLAGTLIVVIEAALTLSLGLCLSGLFLFLSRGEGVES